MRPGVATTTSTPARSFFCCGSSGTPPNTGATSSSYHLFFLSPNGDEFDSETECEVEADPEYDEETGEEILDGERETITVRGREHAGWSVAVSLVAPIAVITFSDYTVFDDRPADLPSVERYAEDAEGNRFDHAEHFRKMHGERAFQVLEKLRERIAAILEKHGVTVLPEAEWRKPVPWLRGGGDALVGEVVNQPVRVLDAFFFESI